MATKRISGAQAKEFAYAFLSAIPSYIENHKAEYLAYLKETGQTDEYYQNKTETENVRDTRKTA